MSLQALTDWGSDEALSEELGYVAEATVVLEHPIHPQSNEATHDDHLTDVHALLPQATSPQLDDSIFIDIQHLREAIENLRSRLVRLKFQVPNAAR